MTRAALFFSDYVPKGVGTVSEAKPPVPTTHHPNNRPPLELLQPPQRDTGQPGSKACTHGPTPTYQVNTVLWHPADFLHTQREGWQLDFHLGQMSFFNHVTLGPSQLREAQPVRTHGGQCPGSARGCTLLLPKALRPAHGASSPWTRLQLIP